MSATLRKPRHVKYRRESSFGLVYDHENYGYEDASLTTVDERIVDLLAHVEEGEHDREALEAAFSPAVVETAVREGFLRVA
ncbi:MAG: mycofactocin biosynthesis chaperone MftB2 [Haloarculaceae archaeon]